MGQEQLERVSVKQAALELNMNIESVRYLMLKGRLPIGEAIKRPGSKRGVFYIYRAALDRYKADVGKILQERREQEDAGNQDTGKYYVN